MKWIVVILLSVAANVCFATDCKFLIAAAKEYELSETDFAKKFKFNPLNPTSFVVTSAKVERQAQEAANFTAWLYRQFPVSTLDLFPFKYIEIVPSKLYSWQCPLEIEGDTLIIRLGIFVHTADDLRAIWQKGKHLPRHSAERTVFKYANPSGLSMKVLKSVLLTARKFYDLEFKQLLNKHREDPSALREALKAHILATTGTDLGEDLVRLVDQIEDAELAKRMEGVAATLGVDQSVIDFMGQIKFTLATQLPAQQEGAEIYIRTIAAFYGIGNFHWIRVTVGYGEKSVALAASTIPPFRKLDVWMILTWIGVYTVDVIDIHTFAEKLYLASALEAALRK